MRVLHARAELTGLPVTSRETIALTLGLLVRMGAKPLANQRNKKAPVDAGAFELLI
jgi:hypothetical protein